MSNSANNTNTHIALEFSIRAGYLMQSEFDRGEFFEFNSRVYSSNVFATYQTTPAHLTRVIRRTAMRFCPAFGGIVDTNNTNFVRAFVSHKIENGAINWHAPADVETEIEVSTDYLYSNEPKLIHCTGGSNYSPFYADLRTIESRGFVHCVDTGDIEEKIDCFEISAGVWQAYPAGRVNPVRSYHSNTTPHIVRFSNKPRAWFVGFEAEKEDTAVKFGLDIRDLENACEGWRKESDGSLHHKRGFEFISPMFELDIAKIRKELTTNAVISSHLRAGYSERCGGHIHLSKTGLSGVEVFDRIAGYLPLLHALFPARANGKHNEYARAGSSNELRNSGEKKQSVRIFNNRIEFRIFGAITGIENILWRLELVRLMAVHPAGDCAQGFENIVRFLDSHLRIAYKNEEAREKLYKRAFKYARMYETFTPDADFLNANKLIFAPFSFLQVEA
jgi:hypothetical protein